MISGCEHTETEETTAETDPVKKSIYTDYYTDVPPIIAEFPEWDGKIEDDSTYRMRKPDRYCFTENGLYRCDITENPDHASPIPNIDNGIFYESFDGERRRICPEKSCNAESVCRHITLKHTALCTYEDKLYIAGVPVLDSGFYENTCIMELDLQTGVYTKIAEIPVKEGEFWQQSHYLFFCSLVSETSSILYGIDLKNMTGFRTWVISKTYGPCYQAIRNDAFLVNDQKNLYLSDSHNQLETIYTTENRFIYLCSLGDDVYFMDDRVLYRMNLSDKEPKALLENVYNAAVQDDTIWFLSYEEVTGLLHMSPYENADGRIAYETIDYPLFSGKTIYRCDLNGENIQPVLTKEAPDFLGGDVYAAGDSIYYTVLHGTEEVLVDIPETFYRFIPDTGTEIVIKYRKEGSVGYEC